MRKIGFLSIWLGMWILCAEAQEVTIFVAEKGSDDAAGTLEAPFATLEKAMETVQKACADKEVEHATIYFRGGRYFATKNRYFKNLDFSHMKTPLRISNWKDERVVILGSRKLTGWKDEGNGRFSTPIPESIPDPAILRTLYLNDTTMTWARWPNLDPRYPYSGGWAYVAGEPFGMYTNIPDEPLNTIVMRETKPWKHPERGDVLIFPRHNWSNNIRKIASLDPTTQTLTSDGNFRFAARPCDRYCVYGMLEELDAPGEWAADWENRRILFIPPEGTTLESLENDVSIGILHNVLVFFQCRNITLHGLTLTGSLGNGI
ncbi:MAG: hypothetical protein Q4E67_06070, partial [Planctomycetia bacterium]|nr:hypothetical protein [Planctomycetia bacterium]